MERIVFFVLFPALLFHSTATTRFNFGTTGDMLICGMVTFGCGIILGFLARWLFDARSGDRAMLFASGVQTSFRFNSYIALAIAGRLSNNDGIALMALLLGIHVPIANAAAVYALAKHSNNHVLREMARNPLIIATLSGLLFNVLGLQLPEFAAMTLTRLGNASIALGLISVGAGLRLSGASQEKGMITWWLCIKLLIMPAIAWMLALHYDLPPLQRQIVVLFTGLPTASSAFILATRLGGSGAIVAFLISASTLLSIVTLPLWLLLVR